MMNNSYKKDILKNIIGSKGVVLGNPAAQSTVKFQFATSIATAAGSTTPGALTFAADDKGNAAIYAQGTLVSSKIQNVVATAASGAKHGGKTITVTYIGDAGSIQTSTFDVIDETALEAYFAQSKTIALDAETNRYEVKTKANGGIAVDTEGAGLYAVLSDIFGVDGNTIGFKSDNKTIESLIKIAYIDGQSAGNTGNDRIALTDKNGVELTHVDVQDIIGGGIVSNVVYNPDNNSLTIYWIGGATTTIDLSKLFDISDWAVETGSENFLHLAIDASTAKIGVKKADVTFTAATQSEDASLTVNTTNGEILVASDAIPAIVEYVKATQNDNGIAVESKNLYIDASIDANNNKKINLEAQVANLTVGKEGDADSTLSGVANKLAKSDDTATKVQAFVNTRIAEEVAKLDSSIDSIPGTFVSVGVAEVDGKITSVVVHENIGSITGTTSSLSGESGLADAANIATAVKTYIDGQIDALDSSVSDKSADNYISIAVEATNGKLTSAEVDYTKSTVTFDNTPGALDLTATNGILTNDAIAQVKAYVDAKSGALDSSVDDTDNGKGYVYVKTVQDNGALTQQIVNVSYGEITAAPGAITIDQNGIIDSSVLKEAVEGALVWTILS